jgi:hypothetical protein
MASRLKRSVPVTVLDVLDGQVVLDLECLDRLYLYRYLGPLQGQGRPGGPYQGEGVLLACHGHCAAGYTCGQSGPGWVLCCAPGDGLFRKGPPSASSSPT